MNFDFIAKTQSLEEIDFQAGAIVLIDKPMNWTSFDVVNKIRYAVKRRLKVRRIKVGHAGTLDPLASGLLVVCIGRKTKIISELQAGKKVYTGTFFFGKTTPSYDSETEAEGDDNFSTEHLNEALLEERSKQFIGRIDQQPPIFSALKVDGKALYRYARAGKTDVKIKTRSIEIEDLSFTDFRWPEVDFCLSCSKGTYVRSLAHDLGKAVDSGAYLKSLRRMASGQHQVGDAWQLSDFIDALYQHKKPDESESG